MDTFNNLPTPAKAGIALASGAGLLGTIALLTGGNTTVLLIIALGIVVVGAMLVAYKFVLKWLGKRKAAPLERGILNNSAASPNSISEPARRARLDDLRRSFEGGVEKFRASGKNIYSLPWYVLVGEPEKALDQLEPLLRMPYYLSPGWLKIDPTFAPLRGNSRFERLIAGR